MSYRVELHVAALSQMKGLPGEALDALISRTTDLLEEPEPLLIQVGGLANLRHTEEVTGSIPVSPTTFLQFRGRTPRSEVRLFDRLTPI